jgi:hypothetical protein
VRREKEEKRDCGDDVEILDSKRGRFASGE